MATSVSSLSSNFFPSAQNGFTTTTSGSVSSGAATVGLASVAGYSNGQIAVFVIDPTDATKKQTFTGVIDTSGVQVTSVVWTAGTNQSHALGATVVDYETATHWSMVAKGVLIAHEQTGIHKAGLVLPTPKITTSINDSGGNEVIVTPATASAVNEITVTNAATGVAPSISASGSDAAANLNLRGKGLAKTVTIGAGATPIFPYDYVVSGCVLSGDSYASTLNFSMTSGVVVINGNPVTVASFSAAAATASKDTYVDVLDNGDGTGLVVKTGGNIVNNNAASPALASNSIRIGIVVSGAGSIAAAASINQGEETKILPIASSIPYAVTDSLGNLICPRDPNRKVLGYRQILSTVSSATSGSMVDITGLSCPFISPGNRKVKATIFAQGMDSSHAAASTLSFAIREGSTTLADSLVQTPVTQYRVTANAMCLITPSAGLHTYLASLQQSGTGTFNVRASATEPAFVLVELA